jgi:hypothetical protein
VPLGAPNGLFITLLDDLLSGLKDPVGHPFALLLCSLINNLGQSRVLRVNLHSQKQIEKCQTTDFFILELLFNPKEEASR